MHMKDLSGIIAGGKECMFRASENAQDNGEADVRDLAAYNPTPNDLHGLRHSRL